MSIFRGFVSADTSGVAYRLFDFDRATGSGLATGGGALAGAAGGCIAGAVVTIWGGPTALAGCGIGAASGGGWRGRKWRCRLRMVAAMGIVSQIGIARLRNG